MKICQNCGHENSDTGKFCEECGTKLLDSPKFCPECGNKLEGTPKFCPECGCNLATCVKPEGSEDDYEEDSYDAEDDENEHSYDSDDDNEYSEEVDDSDDYEEYVDEDEYEDDETTEEKIKKIVDKYLPSINKDGTYYRSSAVQNSEYSQVFQNIRTACIKDANIDVKQSELIGFIDTTAFGKGKNGLLFTTSGIFHKQAGFKGFYLMYFRMSDLAIEGSNLTFKGTAGTGFFSIDYSILNMFNLPALKDCLEEIYAII